MDKIEKRMQMFIGSIMGGFGMFIITSLKNKEYKHALICIAFVLLVCFYIKCRDNQKDKIIKLYEGDRYEK